MADPATRRTRMTHVALHTSSSSSAFVPSVHVVGCVLDLLGHTRPRPRGVAGSTI